MVKCEIVAAKWQQNCLVRKKWIAYLHGELPMVHVIIGDRKSTVKNMKTP